MAVFPVAAATVQGILMEGADHMGWMGYGQRGEGGRKREIREKRARERQREREHARPVALGADISPERPPDIHYPKCLPVSVTDGNHGFS